ncbi:histidine phosphatase family protein [Deinococcus sp. Arct2-2]|uniref:histidine phosphatase family protein n=1 Tax=Deinococcus sp. Arct2-2 TaxID=2568653 RepID=UPI0010A51F13|nr:histidine phosphatase family protein [Deinococcus sp. Arct2-2]THF68685.1 histidine phosphatase family protein [Deinococcus sp. Arct2-2]
MPAQDSSPDRLFLVRHGRTAGNVSQVLTGGADDPLDEVGQAQVEAVARWFAAQDLESPRIYTSSYLRARQTGTALAQALRGQITVIDGLQEIAPGDWQGRAYSDMHTHAHELVRSDGSFGFPGGESLEEVAIRFRTALQPVLAQSGTPIIVAHGGSLIAYLTDLMGADVREAWLDGRYAHANTAVTELRKLNQGWHAVSIAATGHLENLENTNKQ